MATSKKKQGDNSLHWVIGVVLLITGVLIITALIVNYSQSQGINGPTNANVEIGNIAPVFDGFSAFEDTGGGMTGFTSTPGAADTIGFVIGGSTNVRVNLNVNDENGFSNQVITVTAKAFRFINAGSSGCSQDSNDCLPEAGGIQSFPASCQDTGGTETSHSFTCHVLIPFQATQTVSGPTAGQEWRFLFNASDSEDSTDDDSSVAFEWPTFVGLEVPNTLDLGTTNTDGIPTPLVLLPIMNKGNETIDVRTNVNKNTDALAWNCSGLGNPLISDLKHSDVATDYGSMQGLTNNLGSVTFDNFDLRRQQSPSDSARDLNFSFATTQSVDNGLCTLQSIILTAVQNI